MRSESMSGMVCRDLKELGKHDGFCGLKRLERDFDTKEALLPRIIDCCFVPEELVVLFEIN